MALPKLNTAPKYELTVPSTKQKLRFRPFLVKEQKVLLIAYESQDRRQIVQSVLDIIEECVENVDIKTLTTFDVDYIFTKIRSKAVGEKINVNLKCKECNTQNEISIDLDTVNVEVIKQQMDIKINDQISLKMKYPDYDYFLKHDSIFENNSKSEILTQLVASCIESVQTDDENLRLEDESMEEVETFINSLSASQFNDIQSFIEKLPKIKKDVNFNCIKCGSENNTLLQGLDDFF